jgi:tetratricopeptide (TPR) repeat protein
VVHFYKLTISMLNNPTLDVYRELGEYLIDEKLYTESAEVFREAADHPAFAEARWIFLYFLTYPLEFDGKTDEALAVIAEARGSQPDNPQLHFQEAWIHYHAQQWDRAETLFKEVIDQYKSDPDNERLVRNSQFSLSNVYVQRGDKEQGEKVLEEVLKDAPDDPQANNDLGYLWADDNKNLDQARSMIEKALASEPENPAYLDSMGWVLYRLEQFAEARTHLEKAIAQENGEDSTIYDHYGDVLEKLGEQEAAVKAWTKALELEQEKPKPDDELLQKLRGLVPDAAASAEGAVP